MEGLKIHIIQVETFRKNIEYFYNLAKGKDSQSNHGIHKNVKYLCENKKKH